MASFPTCLPILGLGREREVRASSLLEDRKKWAEEHDNRQVHAPLLEERASAISDTLFYKILGENSYWSSLSHVPTSLMNQMARKMLCNDWLGLAHVPTLRPERWGILIGGRREQPFCQGKGCTDQKWTRLLGRHKQQMLPTPWSFTV